jgi:hypothetical protein
MMIAPTRRPVRVARRWGLTCFIALGFVLGCIVPIAPQSEASAQVAAAVKRSAARAATQKAASRQATRSAAARVPVQGQSAGSKGSATACRALNNKCNGIRRENAAQRLLAERFPNARVQAETFLRNRNGTKARDPKSGKGRRIDFVLFDRGTAVKRFEITSQFAQKKAQIARESRILRQRKNGQPRTGPVYVRDRKTGKLVPIDRRPAKVIRLN